MSNHYLSLLKKFNFPPIHNNSITRNLIIILSLKLPIVSTSYHHITPSLLHQHNPRYKYPNLKKQYSSNPLQQIPLMVEPNRSYTTSTKMTNETEEIKNKKHKLRQQIRTKLKSLSQSEVQTQSSNVWNKLIELAEYKNSKSIGIFLSMPQNEIKTNEMLYHIIQDGKELYVPRVGTNFEQCDMDMIRVVYEGPHFHNENLFYKDWDVNKWGIPEPPHSPGKIAKPGDIDLLLVPGLAFDKFGGRLGQGKGYYDRFIKEHSEKRMVLVAVGLAPQFLDGDVVPMLDHDYCMDILVSPDFIWTNQS